MTQEEALTVLAVLTAAYPTTEITEPTVKIYVKFLLDIPYEAAYNAVLKLIAQSKWFPSVAELRETAFEIMHNIPSAEEAWGEVIELIHTIGFYGQPKFSNPLIIKTIKAIGGWGKLCNSENIEIDRANFMRVYENYRKQTFIIPISNNPQIIH